MSLLLIRAYHYIEVGYRYPLITVSLFLGQENDLNCIKRK